MTTFLLFKMMVIIVMLIQASLAQESGRFNEEREESGFHWNLKTGLMALLSIYLLETLRRYLREKRLHIQGNWRSWVPIFGPLTQTVLVVLNRNRLYDFILEIRKEAGTPTFGMIGAVGPRIVMVTDPLNLEFVLNNPDIFIKGKKFQRFMHALLGDGIFNSNGEQWIMQRKLAGHIFTVRSLREMIPVFERHSHHLIPHFESRVPSSENPHPPLLDVQDVFLRFTLDSFSEISGMGQVNSLIDPKPFAKAFDAAQYGVTQRFINPLYQVLGPLAGILGSEKLLKSALQVVNQHAQALIQTIRQEAQHAFSSSSSSTHRTDLVTRYLQADSTLETTYLRDAVTNFLLAGRDTTAVCLAWSVYELANHPDVHEQLAHEVEQIIGSSQTLTYENLLKQMPYMKAFISEVLRLHPSVPWDPKETVQDITLPGGQTCPAGTVVSWVAYLTGRDPAIWPDPLKFEPRRWLESEKYNGGIAITTYAFPAFQPGKRSCLGKQLAYAEISFVLTKLCQQGYRFEIPADIHPTYVTSVTLMTSNLLVRVSKP